MHPPSPGGGWPKGDETQELQDRDFLLGRYVNDQMSIQQIADLVGCGVGRVRKALREHEIPVRWGADGIHCRWTGPG